VHRDLHVGNLMVSVYEHDCEEYISYSDSKNVCHVPLCGVLVHVVDFETARCKIDERFVAGKNVANKMFPPSMINQPQCDVFNFLCTLLTYSLCCHVKDLCKNDSERDSQDLCKRDSYDEFEDYTCMERNVKRLNQHIESEQQDVYETALLKIYNEKLYTYDSITSVLKTVFSSRQDNVTFEFKLFSSDEKN